MLVFCFRPQREPLEMIELKLSAMPYIVIKYLAKCNDWISRIGLINTIPWFYLISSILWSDLINYYYLIQFNYFDSNCSYLHLPVEGGEISSQ